MKSRGSIPPPPTEAKTRKWQQSNILLQIESRQIKNNFIEGGGYMLATSLIQTVVVGESGERPLVNRNRHRQGTIDEVKYTGMSGVLYSRDSLTLYLFRQYTCERNIEAWSQ